MQIERDVDPAHKQLGKVTPPWRGAHYCLRDDYFDAHFKRVNCRPDIVDDNEFESWKASKKKAPAKAASKSANVAPTSPPPPPVNASDEEAVLIADESDPGQKTAATDRPKPENRKHVTATDDVDLRMWGTGQADYLLKVVKQKIFADYNVRCTTTEKCLQVLVDENIITMEESSLNPDAPGFA